MKPASGEAARFKRLDAASYESVVDSFGRFASRYSGPLAERMLDLADLAPRDRVLDVGAGTGVVTLEAARRLEPDGRVIGVDLSQGMLRRAARDAAAAGAHRVSLQRQDAEALAFADGSFDAVLSLYALFHFPDPARALAEQHRVLRPGGRLVVAVGSPPSLGSPAGLHYALRRAPLLLRLALGRWLAGPALLDSLVESRPTPAEPAESPLARSPRTAATRVVELVKAAGFVKLACSWEAQVAFISDPEEYWELQATLSSRSRKHLLESPKHDLDALKSRFLERCARVQSRGGRLTYPYVAYFVAARRPGA